MFQFSLQYKEAIKIAKKVAHSMGKEEIRYYLKSFFLHKADDGKHYAVSTDGHRLTRLEVHTAMYDGSFPGMIFPASAIKQIESLKPSNKSKSMVAFKIDDSSAYTIECEGQIAGGKLLEATYPDYHRVIPSGWQDFGNEYKDIGFSPVYLGEIMKAASYNADTFGKSQNAIRIFFEGGSPAVIVEEKDPSVLYVLMPKRAFMPEHQHKPKATAQAAVA